MECVDLVYGVEQLPAAIDLPIRYWDPSRDCPERYHARAGILYRERDQPHHLTSKGRVLRGTRCT